MNKLKIFTRNEVGDSVCYIQLKDLKFLSELTENHILATRYNQYIKNGKQETDFIKETNPNLINAYQECPDIIDFTDYQNQDLMVLNSIYLSLLKTTICDEIKHKCNQHHADDLLMLMDYKKGDTNLEIPMVPNGVFGYEHMDLGLYFYSSIFENYCVLKSTTLTKLQDKDYKSFMEECIDAICVINNAEVEEIKENLKDDCIIIKLKKVEPEKHHNPLAFIKSKLTKENEG